MDITLPHADVVGGDLMAASKTLALLGWAIPAVLTARVAYEAALWRLIETRRLESKVDGRRRPMQASRALKRKRIFSEEEHEANLDMYSRLSNVAHGKQINLPEAVELIELAGERLTFLEGLIVAR